MASLLEHLLYLELGLALAVAELCAGLDLLRLRLLGHLEELSLRCALGLDDLRLHLDDGALLLGHEVRVVALVLEDDALEVEVGLVVQLLQVELLPADLLLQLRVHLTRVLKARAEVEW